MRWAREIRLGVQLSVTGGRDAWIRLALVASGIGVAVAVLLVAASWPTMAEARQERHDARSYELDRQTPESTDQTLLIAYADTSYHGESVYGRLLEPEAPGAPAPPGVTDLPGPGEMVVSPELKRLLDSPEGRLLRERLDYSIVGTIGDEGLVDPGELAYYAGAAPDLLSSEETGRSERIDGFGTSRFDFPRGGETLVLALTGAVVALLPLGVFVAAALRFGADRRDRRLAVLRLLGADRWTAARTACGETLIGALVGTAAGFALFFPLRGLVPSVQVGGVSGFAADIVPHPLLAVAIPIGAVALAVGVTLVSTARAAADPLAAARRASWPRRRLWWRAALLTGGTALLLSSIGADPGRFGRVPETAVVGGVLLVLLGAGLVTPWLFQVAVSRARRGGVPWLLAVRRLQADGAAESRAVVGLVVIVTGAVALQTLFAGIQMRYADEEPVPGERVYRTDVPELPPAGAAEVAERLSAVPQVRDARAVVEYWHIEGPNDPVSLRVGSCSALRDHARIGECSDGDVFAVEGTSTRVEEGQRLRIPDADGAATWELPEVKRSVAPRDPSGLGEDPVPGSVLATPGAVAGADLPRSGVSAVFGLDPLTPRAVEEARNAVAELSPMGTTVIGQTSDSERERELDRIGALVTAGVGASLLVVGLGLVISAVERLRGTKRELAVLAASGVDRRTLALSVLAQATIPLAVGLAVSLAVGVPLGAALLRIAEVPVAFDIGGIAAITAASAAVVLSVTVLSLPALAKAIRPENLRAE
ncbi:hypothetical protein LP52_05895 [Streptomonospora alba]|uniref:ABC3 transporter permease C-terminal domain-containing protein n=1 Tax=Streptomonospora alba TaxID=183763 RepID=A0A0C2JSK0_9ACTN|nr:hypothetical protein LP52_05895 [Streptomonospora alba]